jgi:hypothetical protein
MGIQDAFRYVPAYPTARTRHHDAFLLTGGLLTGLFVFIPMFALTVRWLDVPLPMPTLLGVVAVLGVYTVVTVLIRRIVIGSFVALLVLSTFGANVPLPGLERAYAGALGPQLWLFEPALVIGLGIAAIQRWDRDVTFTYTHALFAAFIVWSALAAVFGAGTHPIAAWYFTLHLLLGFVVFALVTAAIQRGVLDLLLTVTIVGLSALAHAAISVVWLLHGAVPKLTRLGGGGQFWYKGNGVITVGPVSITGGPFLTGFTGNASALSALLLFIAPVLVCYALLAPGRSRSQRVLASSGAVALFAFINLTMKDSARGAAFITLLVIVGVVGYVAYRSRTHTQGHRTDIRTRLTNTAVTLGLSVVVLLYPSSESGSTVYTPSQPGDTPSANEVNSGRSAEQVASRLAELQVPLFDISTLGVRARQYLAAFDVSVRHPVFGLGGGQFPYIAALYGLPDARAAGVDVGNAIHNAYLAVLVGTGFPGLVLFVATLMSVLLGCWRLVQRRTVARWLGFGLACGLLGYLALIFWNVLLVSIPGFIPFWILAGAIVGTTVSSYDGREQE